MSRVGRNEAPPAPGLGNRFGRLAVSGGASNLADGVFKLALPLAAIVFT